MRAAAIPITKSRTPRGNLLEDGGPASGESPEATPRTSRALPSSLSNTYNPCGRLKADPHRPGPPCKLRTRAGTPSKCNRCSAMRAIGSLSKTWSNTCFLLLFLDAREGFFIPSRQPGHYSNKPTYLNPRNSKPGGACGIIPPAPKGRGGGIGRHAVLRGPWAKARVGSSPALGTKRRRVPRTGSKRRSRRRSQVD